MPATYMDEVKNRNLLHCYDKGCHTHNRIDHVTYKLCVYDYVHDTLSRIGNPV